MAFGHGLVGVSSVVRDTTEQTFTEDFLETKTCPKSRCKVRRYLPYLVSKTTTA